MKTISLALAISLALGAAPALADEPAAVMINASNAKNADAIRAEIEKRVRASGVELLAPDATRAAIAAFLKKGALFDAPDEALHALRKQMGASHLALVRELPREKGSKNRVPFQVKVYGPNDAATVRVTSVPDDALVRTVADFVAELLPRQLIEPSNEPDDQGEGEDQAKPQKTRTT